MVKIRNTDDANTVMFRSPYVENGATDTLQIRLHTPTSLLYDKEEKIMDRLIDDYLERSHPVIRFLDIIVRGLNKFINWFEPKTKKHEELDKRIEELL